MRIENVTGNMARWLLGVVMAFGVTSAATAGIATTKHNLGTTGTSSNHVSSGTAEICVFCHTPHAAGSGSAPLWNKGTVASTYSSYTTTTSATIDGTVLPVGSISIACLSCHDGTQAMDNLINAPGSGGYNATGASAGYSWTINALMPAGVTKMGTDLTDDHPIGIQYCGGGVNTSDTTTATCIDKDFNILNTSTINASRVWWVDTTGGTVNRDKTDMILFSRDFGAGKGIGPSVECGSCHDVHTDAQPTFLRTTNAGSAVCLACHNK